MYRGTCLMTDEDRTAAVYYIATGVKDASAACCSVVNNAASEAWARQSALAAIRSAIANLQLAAERLDG